MLLKDGNTVNYGVIRRNENEVVYYTGKGLRERWRPSLRENEKTVAENIKKIGEEYNCEQKLIESGHITVTPLEQIVRVIF